MCAGGGWGVVLLAQVFRGVGLSLLPWLQLALPVSGVFGAPCLLLPARPCRCCAEHRLGDDPGDAGLSKLEVGSEDAPASLEVSKGTLEVYVAMAHHLQGVSNRGCGSGQHVLEGTVSFGQPPRWLPCPP